MPELVTPCQQPLRQTPPALRLLLQQEHFLVEASVRVVLHSYKFLNIHLPQRVPVLGT